MIEERGLSSQIELDSAGTGSWHAGEPPDTRMQAAAGRRGYTLSGAARSVIPRDFEMFDLILAMDDSNLRALRRRCPEPLLSKVRLFRSFDPEGTDNVPDPYYGDAEGFDEVVTLAIRTNEAMLDQIQAGALGKRALVDPEQVVHAGLEGLAEGVA